MMQRCVLILNSRQVGEWKTEVDDIPEVSSAAGVRARQNETPVDETRTVEGRKGNARRCDKSQLSSIIRYHREVDGGRDLCSSMQSKTQDAQFAVTLLFLVHHPGGPYEDWEPSRAATDEDDGQGGTFYFLLSYQLDSESHYGSNAASYHPLETIVSSFSHHP
jgi:hypothetical protein